jgi:hypothetical protein
MALTVHRISPIAHLPLILGVVRKLEIAAIIDGLIPPNPANVLSWHGLALSDSRPAVLSLLP